MKNPSPRKQAAKILTDIFINYTSLNKSLATAFKLINNEHKSLVQEMCYGTLRWYWQLDALSRLLIKKPLKEKDMDIYALVLIGLYQLMHMRTAKHAAINETAEAARELKKPWAVGLINAVLREFQRNSETLLSDIANNPAAQTAHPKWLLKLLQKSWPHAWSAIIEANNQHPPLTLRVNRLQQTRASYLDTLKEQGISAHPSLFASHGITLEQPQDITQLPGFAAGEFSVQDEAAQLAANLLDLAPGQTVLDACAAPGGKTAHILETEPHLADLYAIDIDEERLIKIKENLQRLGLTQKAKLICTDASQPLTMWTEPLFDRILVDAPCSATGVIRRHPDIKWLRRAEDISTLSQLQLQLLKNLWPLLKQNGLLVYATCSVLHQENSDVVSTFLAEQADAEEKLIDTDWGISANVGKQLFPQNKGHDGFYYACLKKR